MTGVWRSAGAFGERIPPRSGIARAMLWASATGMIIGDQTVNAGLDEGIMWLMATGHDMDSERKSKEAQAQRNAGVATEPN